LIRNRFSGGTGTRPLEPPEYALFLLRRIFDMGKRVLKRDGYVKRGVKCAPEQVKQGAGARETSCLCGKTPFGGTPILSRSFSRSRTS